MADGVALLGEAIGLLRADDVQGRSLDGELVALERLRNQLDAQIARRLAEFDRRGDYVLYANKSTAGWLNSKLRVRWGDAYRRVHCARDVEALPEVCAAWRDGAISSRHVETIVRIRNAAKANDEFAEFEHALTAVARAGTADDVSSTGRQWRHALDDAKQKPDDTLAMQAWERRGLNLEELDELGFLNATFEISDLAFVRKAVERERERLHIANDPRSYRQELADGLVSIMRQYLGGLPVGNNHPHLLVATDLPTLRGDAVGLCETEQGTRISPDAARRIACEANISSVLLAGDSVPLDLGRTTRLFSLDQRKAMIIRDGRCRFPGCRRPPDQCEAHHTNPWENGGQTNLDHGGLLCWIHHRFSHEGRWKITVDSDGAWHWQRPDGTHYGTTRPRVLPVPVPVREAA